MIRQGDIGYVTVNGDIQAAIDAAATHGGGRVFIPPGSYTVSAPIRHRWGVSVYGFSAAATTIVAADGYTGDLWEMVHDGPGYWHFGGLYDLTFNGGTTARHAVNIGAMGEQSEVARVRTRDVTGDGFYISGDSTPTRLDNVSGLRCGGSVVNLDGFRRHATITHLSGDNNGRLLRVNGNSAGQVATVTVNGLKAERSVDGKHDVVVLLDSFVGAFTLVGGNFDAGGIVGPAAIRRTGEATHVNLLGCRSTSYTDQYDDQVGVDSIGLGSGSHSFSLTQ